MDDREKLTNDNKIKIKSLLNNGDGKKLLAKENKLQCGNWFYDTTAANAFAILDIW